MERCYLMKTHSLQLLFSHLEERRMVESQQRGRLGRFWRLCDTIFPCFIIFIQFFMVFVVLKLQILDFCTKIKISDFFFKQSVFQFVRQNCGYVHPSGSHTKRQVQRI